MRGFGEGGWSLGVPQNCKRCFFFARSNPSYAPGPSPKLLSCCVPGIISGAPGKTLVHKTSSDVRSCIKADWETSIMDKINLYL